MATTVSDLRAKGQVREKIKQGNTQTPSEKGTCSYGNIEERAENNAEVIIKWRRLLLREWCLNQGQWDVIQAKKGKDVPGTEKSTSKAPGGRGSEPRRALTEGHCCYNTEFRRAGARGDRSRERTGKWRLKCGLCPKGKEVLLNGCKQGSDMFRFFVYTKTKHKPSKTTSVLLVCNLSKKF